MLFLFLYIFKETVLFYDLGQFRVKSGTEFQLSYDKRSNRNYFSVVPVTALCSFISGVRAFAHHDSSIIVATLHLTMKMF